MGDQKLLNAAKAVVGKLYSNSNWSEYPFHNFGHTLQIFNLTKQICVFEKLNTSDTEPILLAALFHDTGLARIYKGHEFISAAFAQEFLTENKFPKRKIKLVVDCILATQIPNTPKNHAERILCDAVMGYMANTSITERALDLQLEWDYLLKHKKISGEWRDTFYRYIKGHRYHTNYGKVFLSKNKVLAIA